MNLKYNSLLEFLKEDMFYDRIFSEVKKFCFYHRELLLDNCKEDVKRIS